MDLKKVAEKKADAFYFVVRVLTGLLFLMIGSGKLFGAFGGSQVGNVMSLVGLAGIIEFFGGLLILLGLFTRVASVLTGVTMLVAFIMHTFGLGMLAGNGFILNPLASGGERALLYLMLFLIIFVKGTGRWGLDNKIRK